MLETKIDTGKTAVLAIDMQNDLIKVSEEPFNAVSQMVQAKGMIANTAKVISEARRLGMPVIYAGHIHRNDNADMKPTITDVMLQGMTPPARVAMVEGTAGAQIVDEIKPEPDDHVIWKRRSNAFYCTDLELMLRARGIDTVIIVGAVTNGCVANTIRGARERDLHIIVLSDCVATMRPEDDEYFVTQVFPREGRVRTSEEIVSVLQNS
jgi:nicotinamidase-related amidase